MLQMFFRIEYDILQYAIQVVLSYILTTKSMNVRSLRHLENVRENHQTRIWKPEKYY